MHDVQEQYLLLAKVISALYDCLTNLITGRNILQLYILVVVYIKTELGLLAAMRQ